MIQLTKSLTPEEYRALAKPKRSRSAHLDLRLSEREVTAQIIGTKKKPGFMRVEGWYCLRLQSGVVRGATRGTFMSLGEEGVPDWICLRGNDFCFIELKASDGRLSEAQSQWHSNAVNSGFTVMVANGIGSFIKKYRDIYG